MAKQALNIMPQSRGASYQPSMVRRLWVGTYHTLKRRFVKITLAFLLLVVVLVLGVLGYFFRPAKVNALVGSLIESAFTDPSLVTFKEEATLVEFPALNGRGAVRLFDVVVRSPSDQYDALRIPEVVIYYDLFGLPESALTRVEIPAGMLAVVNANEDGRFIDAGLLKPSEGESEGIALALPEFELRDARVLFRFPSVFAEPQDRFVATGGDSMAYNGQHAYFLDKISARGRIHPEDPSKLLIQGETDCEVWQNISFNGEISRDPSEFSLDLQAQRRGLVLDQELSNCFKPDILKIWELLWTTPEVENRVDVSASVSIKDGQTKLNVEGFYTGSIMYRDVPLRINDVRGTIRFDGSNITIKDAVGRRGNSEVRAHGWLNGVGTPSESLFLEVEVKGLSVDQPTFDALRGTPYPDGSFVFPEWEAYARRDALTKPNRLPIFAQLYDQFQPSGLMNLAISVRSGGKRPGDEIDFDVEIVDMSARMWGSRFGMLDDLIAENEITAKALRSLQRLERSESASLPKATKGATHNAPGFPLEVYNLHGKVNGKLRNDQPNEFRVRGFNREEAARISDQLGVKVEESTKGMQARRRERTGRLFVEVTIRERSRGPGIDNSRVEVTVVSDPLKIDDELMAAVPEDIQRMVRLFSPKGEIVAKRVSIIADGMDPEGTTISLILGLNGIEASYQVEDAKRGVALSDLEAEVRFNSRTGRAQITDAKAKILGIPVKISNFLVSERRPEGGISVEASTDEFELSTRFFDYLPQSAQEIRNFFTIQDKTGAIFGLEGTAKAHFSAAIGPDLSNADGANGLERLEQIEVRIALDAKRVGFSAFAPYELKELKGEVVISIRDDGMEIEVIGLKATAREETLPDEKRSRIEIGGGIFLPNDGRPGSYNFTLKGQRILLSRQLQAGIEGVMRGASNEASGVVSLWRALESEGRPIGRVGLDGKISGSFGEGGETIYAFDIALRDGEITYKDFALPMVGVSGDLLITNTGISFSGFQGTLPDARGARIEVPLLEKRDDGSFVIAIAAKNLPLNESFRAALPQSVRQVYDVIKPVSLASRMAERRKDELEVVDPPSNSVSGEITLTIGEKRFEFSARVTLQAVDIELGVVFEKCNGVIEQRATFVTETDENGKEVIHPTLKGTMNLESAEWQKIRFNDVTSSFQLTGSRFVLPNVRGELYDGNLRAAIDIDASGASTNYRGQVRATRIQLGPLAEAVFGEATRDPDTGENMQGGVDAELTFANASSSGFIGQGRLDVGRIPLSEEELANPELVEPANRGGRPGSFGKVPLLSGLYDVLSLPAGEYFNEAHIFFHLYDRYLELRAMELISDGLAVRTQGDNFILFEPDKNGDQFDLTMVPVLFPRAPSVPGANLVFDAIRGLVLRVYVTGPMDSPRIEALSKRQYKEDFEEEEERIPSPFDDERERKDAPDRVRPEYAPWR